MKLTAVKFKVNENKETRQKKFLEKWKILVGGGSLQAVQFVLLQLTGLSLLLCGTFYNVICWVVNRQLAFTCPTPMHKNLCLKY